MSSAPCLSLPPVDFFTGLLLLELRMHLFKPFCQPGQEVVWNQNRQEPQGCPKLQGFLPEANNSLPPTQTRISSLTTSMAACFHSP